MNEDHQPLKSHELTFGSDLRGAEVQQIVDASGQDLTERAEARVLNPFPNDGQKG